MPASLSRSLGFTTLTVTFAVTFILLLIVSFVVLLNPPGKQAETRDGRRRVDLSIIQQALERYAGNHNGQYPVTVEVTNGYDDLDHHQPQCYLCGLDEYQQNNITGEPFTRDNWIPELVDQAYLPNLPLDPQTGNKSAGLCQAGSWPRGYVYVSNGQEYKLYDFCGPTTGLNQKIGALSPYCVGTNQNVLLSNPTNYPQLLPLVDPKQPSFHYAVYSPGWACK